MRYSIICILTALAATACTTTSSYKNTPPDFDQADRAIHAAKASAAARTLPTTITRAEKTYADAVSLLHKADAASPREPQRQRLLQAAILKANESQHLAEQAQELGLKIASWDGRIETYSEEQTAGQLQQLVAGAMEATCDDGSGRQGSTLANLEFTSPVAFFAAGTDELSDRDMPQIASLVELLQADPSLQVRLVGHADGDGTPEANHQLALRRAKAVGDALAEGGVRAERIEIASSGDEDAGEPGTNAGERQLDRRVEAQITGQDAGWAH